MKSGESRANQNKAIRQQELRDKLSAGGHLENVIEYSNKIADLTNDLELAEVNRLKTAAEIKLKLINKYLPDLKQVEMNLQGRLNIYKPVIKRFDGSMDEELEAEQAKSE